MNIGNSTKLGAIRSLASDIDKAKTIKSLQGIGGQ